MITAELLTQIADALQAGDPGNLQEIVCIVRDEHTSYWGISHRTWIVDDATGETQEETDIFSYDPSTKSINLHDLEEMESEATVVEETLIALVRKQLEY
jgi:hypothetical protein